VCERCRLREVPHRPLGPLGISALPLHTV
jgi:hypothetical protein